jgi:hypothetical protein
MKQDVYNLIVKAVTFSMPALAKEIITELNNTLKEYDKLKQSTETAEVKEEQ